MSFVVMFWKIFKQSHACQHVDSFFYEAGVHIKNQEVINSLLLTRIGFAS